MASGVNRYTSLNSYLQAEFGCKVYKIALQGGMTCPNRDGTLGRGGCLFCSHGGAGEFAVPPMPIDEQIAMAIEKVKDKCKSGKYIAYFQNFTNTYAPVERLRQLFYDAIHHPEVAVLSVATRPDCLPKDVLDLLLELNRIKPVWVELGLQTIHKKTADFIRRGYDLAVYDKAVKDLTARGIKVITHMIIGLPGETQEEMVATARYIGQSSAWGIKLQLLHVVKDSDLYSLYQQGEVQTLPMEEYIRILGECVKVLPKEMVIHRLTGDGDKRTLVAPLWSGDKKRVLQAIRESFEENDVWQGQKMTKIKNGG